MKRLLFFGVLLATAVAVADRLVTYSTARSRTDQMELISPIDGQCMARACGQLATSDGGYIGRSCTPYIQLSGTALTRCLNILNSGDALWRAQEGVQ